MTGVSVVIAALLLLAAAVPTIWCAFGGPIRRPRPRQELGLPTRPPYGVELARLRQALEGARRETEPGAPSLDLDTCQQIWPDAPKYTPKEWS
ncbi:hypothetical protein ACIHFC_29000 [Streptomyces sp. NPDC052013]|uniref:hypothetical protein n=1 Tax=Streptomyces sp. NPDC052013 TaxID=3365679 RepID=UPI0037D46AD3